MTQQEEQEEYLKVRKSEFVSICAELSQVRKRLEELEKKTE
jgi:hypothetical protein